MDEQKKAELLQKLWIVCIIVTTLAILDIDLQCHHMNAMLTSIDYHADHIQSDIETK